MGEKQKQDQAIRIENGSLVIPLATVLAAGANFPVDRDPSRIGVLTLKTLVTAERFASIMGREMNLGMAEAVMTGRTVRIHSDWDGDAGISR
jgi:hypothetical protein